MIEIPSRVVLTNVPQVKFFDGGPRCPEDIPFPSVMRALMESLGEDAYGCTPCGRQPGCKINCSYAFFIGVSGVASFFNWKPGWEGDNVALHYMNDDPEAPYRHAFTATGYAYQGYGHNRDERELYRRQIMASIQRGKPVIAFGPIGPPEPALITGYDEDGDVLIGWSFFQHFSEFNAGVMFEPTGEFRARNWLDYPLGISFFIIGEKQDQPPLKETYRQALGWMIQVARTPVTYGDRANGIAAYDAWADQLLYDEDFPADEGIQRQRHDVHNCAVGTLAEARWYGAQFLLNIAEGVDSIVHRDAIEDLYHAAGYYAGEHGLMWQLWDLAGGNGNPNAWKQFADPSVRRQMVPVIREARDKEAFAIEHLERVLERM